MSELQAWFLEGAMAMYPRATLYLPPGLVEKRPSLARGVELTDAPPQAWAGELEQLVVRGSSTMQEVVFFHPPSRTLIVADLCEHFGPHSAPLTRAMAWIARMYGRPRMPPDWQFSFRDREARRVSFSRLMEWDFDRVILAHDAPLEAGAKSAFQKAFARARA